MDVKSFVLGYTKGKQSGGGGGGEIDALLNKTITEISSTATTIPEEFARDCAALTAVSFPNATLLNSYAFYKCTSLEKINFPKVKTIGGYAFQECKFTSANFPETTYVNMYAFYNCASLANVNIPKAATVGTYAFTASGITSASFPELTDISRSTFANCKALVDINFPKVKTLGQDALFKCSALEVADFPAVTTVNSSSLGHCEKLIALILRSETAVTAKGAPVNSTPIELETGGYIYIPAALKDTYTSATNWSQYATRFRALEDYTVDGTITGELDPNKI